MRGIRAALVVAVVVGIGGSVAWADIEITSWSLTTEVFDDSGYAALVNTSLEVPVDEQDMETLDLTKAKTTYAFSGLSGLPLSGDTVTFDLTMVHERAGIPGGSTMAGSSGFIWFTVTGAQDMQYDISGAYTMPSGNGAVSLKADLAEIGTGTLFASWQRSDFPGPDPTDQTFVLGGTEGKIKNVSSGNSAGILKAGELYYFSYGSLLEDYTTGLPASASGNITLSITPVPVPGAAILGMIGISMVGAYTRKRRQAHVTEA